MDITDLVNQAMNQWAEETNCGETDLAFQGEVGEEIDLLVQGLDAEKKRKLLDDQNPLVMVFEEKEEN
jgi:hypothetical protein